MKGRRFEFLTINSVLYVESINDSITNSPFFGACCNFHAAVGTRSQKEIRV